MNNLSSLLMFIAECLIVLFYFIALLLGSLLVFDENDLTFIEDLL